MEFKDYSENRPIQEKPFKIDDIPLAIFHLTEQGPSVLYRDFEELNGLEIEKTELTHKINNLAANLIAATGSGHSYSEGCFDIKLDNYSNYRLFVIAIKRPNVKHVDPRIKSGYFQIVLFIPRELALTLPSISKMEDALYSAVSKEIKDSEDFKSDQILKLKEKLIEKILTFSN
ncbi:MAG: hypothetical protein ACW99A_14290 [Candidatus Kariarchaeaceae archaeon]